MSSPAHNTSEEERQPDVHSQKLRIRKSISLLLMVLLVSLAVIAHYWERIAVWQVHVRAENLLHAYRDTEAQEVLRQALVIDPNNPDTVLQLARVHRRMGSLQKALLLLQTGQQLGADAKRVALERKLAAVQSGQIRGFDSELPQLIVDSGNQGSDIMQAYVLGLFANLRTEEAFSLIEGWESSSPADPLPKFLQAYLWQGINRLPEAAQAYRKGLELAPYMSLMRVRLAQTLIESGDFPAARAELEFCPEEDPANVQASVLLARCLLAENDSRSALAKLNRALELQPKDLDARRLRGQILLANGNPQRALEDLQFVAQKEPNDAPANEAQGRALQLIGRTEEAQSSFDRASQLTKEQAEIARLIRLVLTEPQNAELRHEIGVRLMQFGSPEDGAKWLRSVFEIQPNHLGAHLALATFWQRRGDFVNAELHRTSAQAIQSEGAQASSSESGQQP